MAVNGQHHALAMLYCQGREPEYPLDMGLGGPQSQSGCRGKKKNPLPLPGKTLVIWPIVRYTK
jgi:hypothetical protein